MYYYVICILHVLSCDIAYCMYYHVISHSACNKNEVREYILYIIKYILSNINIPACAIVTSFHWNWVMGWWCGRGGDWGGRGRGVRGRVSYGLVKSSPLHNVNLESDTPFNASYPSRL